MSNLLSVEAALALQPPEIAGVYCLFWLEAGVAEDRKLLLLPVDNEDVGTRYGAGKQEADITDTHSGWLTPLVPGMLTVISGGDRFGRGKPTILKEVWEEAGVSLATAQVRELADPHFRTRTLQLRGDRGLVVINGNGFETELSAQQVADIEKHVQQTRGGASARIVTPWEVVNNGSDISLRPFAIPVFQALARSERV